MEGKTISLFDIIGTENKWPQFHVEASVANHTYGKVYPNSMLFITS